MLRAFTQFWCGPLCLKIKNVLLMWSNCLLFGFGVVIGLHQNRIGLTKSKSAYFLRHAGMWFWWCQFGFGVVMCGFGEVNIFPVRFWCGPMANPNIINGNLTTQKAHVWLLGKESRRPHQDRVNGITISRQMALLYPKTIPNPNQDGYGHTKTTSPP